MAYILNHYARLGEHRGKYYSFPLSQPWCDRLGGTVRPLPRGYLGELSRYVAKWPGAARRRSRGHAVRQNLGKLRTLVTYATLLVKGRTSRRKAGGHEGGEETVLHIQAIIGFNAGNSRVPWGVVLARDCSLFIFPAKVQEEYLWYTRDCLTEGTGDAPLSV